MVGGSEAFIETLIRLKSSDSRMWMWPSAALTMAVTTSSIGGRTPAPSLGRPGSDPALTPIRIGISRSLARDANDATPRVFEAGDLVECRFDIARVRLRHRLHHDRRGASDDNVADANRNRLTAGFHASSQQLVICPQTDQPKQESEPDVVDDLLTGGIDRPAADQFQHQEGGASTIQCGERRDVAHPPAAGR